MSSQFRLSPCVAVLAVALVLPAGCQRTADNLAEGAIERASNGKVEVERDGDKTTLKTARGEMTMQAGESLPLPASFPKDVYLPGDYAVNSVMDLEGVNVLSLRAPGKVPALFADARAAMAAQGWKETMAMQHSVDNALLAFEKEQRAATLSFNHDGDDGVILGVQLRSSRQ